MSPLGLRARLALWYGGVLLVVLLLFSALSYAALRWTLMSVQRSAAYESATNSTSTIRRTPPYQSVRRARRPSARGRGLTAPP